MPQDAPEPPPPPIDLGLIADTPPPAADVVPTVQEAFRLEQQQHELDKSRLVVDSLRHQLEEQKLQTAERTKYAKWTFWLMVVWLAVIAYALFAQGFGVGFHRYGRFHLADSVLIALITTSTATIVGIFIVVMNYLFPKK